MGLSNFPSPSEGVLQVLVMNTVFSMQLFKNMVKYVLHFVGISLDENSSNLDEDYSSLSNEVIDSSPPTRKGRILTTTLYKYLCRSKDIDEEHEENSESDDDDDYDDKNNRSCNNKWSIMECCVCLNRFEGDEEVSELSCKHFFHKGCLQKWFDNQHTTCPLCRSFL